MKSFALSIFLLLVFVTMEINAQEKEARQQYTDYVNPYIGSLGDGHVFVGANVPFGGVQLGPVNIMQKWDKQNGWGWCSGYNYKSEEILGFTHTHLSGTGIGDLNDLLLLPATGPVQIRPMQFGNEQSGYGAFFSHAKEKVSPGYYEVQLDKYGVKAALTATERTGYHQYTFQKTDNAHVLIDLGFAIGWDSPYDGVIRRTGDHTIEGYRFSKGWAADQRFYFALRFSKKIKAIDFYNDSLKVADQLNEVQGARSKAAIYFDVKPGESVDVQVGMSAVSEANAALNINREIAARSFSAIRDEAKEKWNKALSVITYDADEKQKIIFYTALYHSLFAPNIHDDVNGDYLGADLKPYNQRQDKYAATNYTNFSLWDTYRGLHPLMTIIQPQRVNEWVNNFLNIYKQQGKLPVWHLHSNETNCMVGYPAIPVIVDAYLKGFRGYDVNLAYEAVKQSTMQQTDGIQYIQQLKYIPADSVLESVAKALEYAISDYAVAQMAEAMGKKEDYAYYMKRAGLYKMYYDANVGYMRGRMADGSWRTPFNHQEAVHRDHDFTEGTAWQYTWLVPQEVKGLMELLGGESIFSKRLDTFFSTPANLGPTASPDVSGLYGQYAQGNEPNHHIAYLYAYTGEQWKTAKLTRALTDSFFTVKPDGLCGNDDMGEMSTWYILSALGFYPVSPTKGDFVFGSPLMKKATIRLPGNKQFVINAVNQSKDNIYIQKITLNGKPYTRSYLKYKDIMSGGVLTITMGKNPSSFGKDKKDRPL
ncbi:MAG: GH92 family glycosyl hydrolase [Niabella sp.]